MADEESPGPDETSPEPKPKRRFSQDFATKLSRSDPATPPAKQELLAKQEEILQRDPRNAGVWVARSLLLYELGRYPEALACLEKVSEKIGRAHVWQPLAPTRG